MLTQVTAGGESFEVSLMSKSKFYKTYLLSCRLSEDEWMVQALEADFPALDHVRKIITFLQNNVLLSEREETPGGALA